MRLAVVAVRAEQVGKMLVAERQSDQTKFGGLVVLEGTSEGRRLFRAGRGTAESRQLRRRCFTNDEAERLAESWAPTNHGRGNVVARGSAGKAGAERADLQVSEPLADSVTREMQPSSGRQAVCSV